MEAFVYRSYFHLSEAEMEQETLESIRVNLKLISLSNKKAKMEAKPVPSVR